MNENNVLIGLDLGTTNAKAYAYSMSGEIVANACNTYPTYYPNKGWSEQKPQDWQNALKASLCQLSSELIKRELQPVGLGLSAHAPGLVLTDMKGRPLADAFPIWQDSRALSESQQLFRDLGAQWVGLGFPVAAFAAKLLWFIQHRPDIATKARYALGVKGFLIHWLTGNFATDPSSEPGNDPYWKDLCQYCGWSLERLPKLLAATDVAGVIRNELADEIGLPRDLPVVMGINDGGSATLANGALMNGESVIQLATNGVVYMATSLPIPAEIRYNHAIFCWRYLEDRWIVGGQTKSGAANLQWLTKLITGECSNTTFDQLLAEAATSPVGSRGVIFLPYLMGRGTPHDNTISHGSFSGLALSTGRADIYRSVLEGVAFAIREIFDEFNLLGIVPKQVYITGGGAQSQLWQQIIANTLDRDVTYCVADSSLGGAILAAVGLGIYADLQSAVKAMTRPVSKFQPQNEAVRIYQDIYKQYTRLGDALHEIDTKY